MDYLGIVRRLKAEAGVGSPAAVLTTVVGLPGGEIKRLADWANDSWLEIQGLHRWGWLWSQPTVTLAEGARTAAGTLSHALYIKDTMRLRPTGTLLSYLPWADFKIQHAQQAPGTPRVWTVRPDRTVQFDGAAPAGGLVFDVEAYARATSMVADADTPAMPAEHHMAIVWLALQKYATFEEAGALYQTAEREYLKILRIMEREQLPDFELGPALC